MPASPALSGVIHLPFDEQIDFFRRKLNLPTERYDDIRHAAHDRAFIVAGALKADLLDDLRQAVERGLTGGTQAEFNAAFRDLVARHGWTGWTGQGSKAGEAWRMRTIYQTNLRASYAAGRWRQLTDPALLARRPYWRYIHSDLVARPRAAHKRWGDARLTLRHDDPLWQTIFPPNGWGCRCRVMAVRAPEEGDATALPGWDAREGGLPPGVDPDWAYAPGANAATPLLDIVARKLVNLDGPVGARMWEALEPALEMEQRLALGDMVDAAIKKIPAKGHAALVGALSPEVMERFHGATGREALGADIWLSDRDLEHAVRDAKMSLGATLPAQTWRDLPGLLRQADVYYDTANDSLIYVFEAGLEKVAIRVNYTTKITGASGRRKEKANFIKTGGAIDGIHSGGQFIPLVVKKDGGGGT